MALTPGIRLGPYELAAHVGVAGMGEVYQVTDANLGRDVAIRLFPESVSNWRLRSLRGQWRRATARTSNVGYRLRLTPSPLTGVNTPTDSSMNRNRTVGRMAA
jgi:hypothetical protein